MPGQFSPQRIRAGAGVRARRRLPVPAGLPLTRPVHPAALLQNGSALSAQECAQCPVGRAVFPAIDPFTCASCSEDPAMSFNAAGECVCDTGFTKTGVPALGVGWCLLDADAAAVSSFSAASAAAIPFRAVESSTGGAVSSIGTVSSIYAAHYFLWAAATCTAYRTTADLAACQTLGNLCVMHHYDDSAAVRARQRGGPSTGRASTHCHAPPASLAAAVPGVRRRAERRLHHRWRASRVAPAPALARLLRPGLQDGHAGDGDPDAGRLQGTWPGSARPCSGSGGSSASLTP